MARIHRLYKKDLHNPDNHNGVITHLEPDILECDVEWNVKVGLRKPGMERWKVKWALGSIAMNKASEVMGFQLSYFKS